MWTFEHTETTAAAPAELWAWYADPSRWPEWDHGLAEVRVDAPIAHGVTGSLKPARGPKTSFRFTEVTPDVSFSTESRLPLARLTVAHRIEAAGVGTRFTHTATIAGPLAPLFARVAGTPIAADVPAAMRSLARLAETPAAAHEDRLQG